MDHYYAWTVAAGGEQSCSERAQLRCVLALPLTTLVMVKLHQDGGHLTPGSAMLC